MKTTFSKRLANSLFCLFVTTFFQFLNAQHQVYTLVGNHTFTPSWHSSVVEFTVEAIGGGGGGGLVRGTSARESGGGGGGAYARGRFPITLGTSFPVFVGRGGKKERGDTDARNGEDSWFGSATSTDATTVVRAMGGQTLLHNDNSSATGGSGGQINATTYTSGGNTENKPASVGNVVRFAGGNGRNAPNNTYGGGGGGAAGSTGNGNTRGPADNLGGARGAGDLLNGATPGSGGVGGIFNGNDNGVQGDVYGGGGGGARKSFSVSTVNRNGLPGAQGIVVISWSELHSLASNATCGTVTITGTNLAGTTSVTLNGTALTVLSNNSTTIVVNMAEGASGLIEVETPFGKSKIAMSTPQPAKASITGTQNICAGQSSTFTAGGAGTYAWSTGATTADITVNTADTYVVTVTSSGCSATASRTLNVSSRPTASLSGTTTICNGLDATLTITATGTAPFSGTLSDGTPFSGSSPITVSISPTATTTYTIATLSDANCTATSGDLSGSATVTVNNCALTWNGSQSTSWNNPLNWTPNIVPNNCALDVIIPSVANQPEIGNATYAIGNLNIADDAFVLFSNSNARLNICGNIVCGINNGSKFVGLGRAVMQGSAAQSISGNLRADILRLNNASGAGFAPKALLEVGGILELENGTFNTAGGILRFISTSVTSCAILDNFSAGFSGTVNGSIEAQRYYEAATDTRLHNQHYFGSPVDAPPVTQFAPAKGVNGVAVTPTNDCDETQTAANGNYGNVFEWEEGLVNTCYLQGWRVRSAGNAQNARGYSVVKQGSGTLTLTGAANLDAQYQLPNLTNGGWLHSSKQGNQFNSGWSLAANPYLAPIDLDAASNSAFDDFVLVLRTHGPLAGTFQPISMSGTQLIAPFQGFLVRKSDDVFTSGYTPASFKVNAADRRVGIATFHKNDEHQLSLKVSGNGYADVTYFNFNPASTEQYDPKFDALKAASSTGQPTLFSFIVGSWASVNTHPDVQSTPYIPLGFRPGKNGTFLFEGEGFADLPNTIVFLEDKKENIMHNLTQVPEYTFTSNKSDAADRFVLHFNYQQPSGTSNIGHSSPDIRLFPNPASGLVYIESQQPTANSQDLSVEVFDISGRKVAATFRPTNSGAGTLEVSLLPSAVYQVRITAASGTVVKRLVKE